ncbi:MAG: IS1182 family transposase [Lactobacillaceae bacterium]|jgi:hypothetical protein|nr:IS1182 family transposase [Lactobacillaceae bacterium]
MLSEQNELNLSPYMKLYDIIIPKDHFLRQVKELVDFSFVYDELINNYSIFQGRTALDPVLMFKYLYLKSVFNLSDRDLVMRVHTDMALKFFLDLAPEDDVIHPTSLTKFRKLRLKDGNLLDLLINKTVTIAIENGVLKSKNLIIDSTHTTARFGVNNPVEILRNSSKELRKAVYAVDESIKTKFPTKNITSELDLEKEYTQKLIEVIEQSNVSNIPNISEKLNVVKEKVEDITERSRETLDADAKLGHKSSTTSFYGYKTHTAMSDERIITAALVTGGEKFDGQFLQELIEVSKRNGVDVNKVIGDTAYSGSPNIKYTLNNGIALVAKLHPTISGSTRNPKNNWEFNKDANMPVCPAGELPASIKHLGAQTNEKTAIQYWMDIKKCHKCPLQEGCITKEQKQKTYRIPTLTPTHGYQLEYQESDDFKISYKTRYKIEAKYSELKNYHGFNRAQSGGLLSMDIQASMAIFTVNLKRIVTLINEKGIKNQK